MNIAVSLILQKINFRLHICLSVETRNAHKKNKGINSIAIYKTNLDKIRRFWDLFAGFPKRNWSMLN